MSDVTPNPVPKVLYKARVHTIGCDGVSRSSDGRLDIKHSLPGSPGGGTNPEQLFAAAWSASFQGVLAIAAQRLKMALPADLAIDAEVDLLQTGDAFTIQARLDISLPGLDQDIARDLTEAAHAICPYSKATRGNISATITVV